MAEELWTSEDYHAWLLEQKNSDYEIEEQDASHVLYRTAYAEAKITIHEMDIIELEIADLKDGNPLFYLHFHLENRQHAENLTNDMLHTLLAKKNTHTVKVLLSCTSGLTTSFFAQQLNSSAEILKLDYTFEATSFNHLFEKGFAYDVILLAPQIQFQYEKVKKIFPDQLVMKISASDFAQYQTGNVIDEVRKQYRRKMDEGIPEEQFSLDQAYHNEFRILTIAFIMHADGGRFGYCIYDHGRKTLNKEVIKPDLSLEDIYDLLDYVFARHKRIDYVAISIPGVAYRGTLDEAHYGFDRMPLYQYLQDRYHKPFMIINDVNAMALGYHAMHEDTDDMVFYFQPHGSSGGGAGVILDGRLRKGFHNNAGETKYVTDLMTENAEEKIRTPEGALEIVRNAALCYIGAIAPKKLIIYCDLIPDEEALREEIGKVVDPVYVPEIVIVRRLKRYMLPGTLIYCLSVISQHPDWAKTEAKAV